ncbi:hypothetical protein [Cryptosporangium sp. NPDC048952]|uniref:hypothetical protein n=1 Tax=Cryptosporangium sp. NPDC048952 TaxID=3363961 RepID=UPI0037106D3A
MLARWESEPTAVQMVLSGPAALSPHHGHAIGEQISYLAQEFDGTRPGSYLHLASALVQNRDADVFAAVTDIVTWDEYANPDWLETPRLPVAVPAGHILVGGVLHSVSSVE